MDTRLPLVSIIIPAYNTEKYIERCLQSIHDQTYQNIEIIVVDDGSLDDTRDIVNDFVQNDNRFKMLVQSNQYAGVARNNGFSQASGEYVMFLDADDFFEPDMVELMVGRAQSTSADVVVCRSMYFDVKTEKQWLIDHALRYVDVEKTYSSDMLSDMLFQFCVGWPWDKLYRTDFVREANLEFQPLRTTNDAYFVFMALVLADRISFVGKALAYHRTGNESSLEYTRARSCENAIIAASSIGERLVANGLYEQFGRSFVNWYLHFSLWNYKTLGENSRNAFLMKARQELLRFLPDQADSGYYQSAENEWFASLLHMDQLSLTESALSLRMISDQQAEEIAAFKNANTELERNLSEFRNRIMHLEAERDTILSSTSYKAGRLLTALPRAVKDRLSGQSG